METQLTNKGKIFNPFKKLIIGILMFSSFFLLNSYIIGGTDGLTNMSKHYIVEPLSFLPGGMSKGLLGPLFSIIVGILMIYLFVSGLYRICTFNRYIPTFENKTPGGVQVVGCDSYPNINRVLNYRESKMCGMSSDRAAELYVGSSKIESLYTGYNNGSETQRTLSYIESKLSGMSSDRGLNYLANKL